VVEQIMFWQEKGNTTRLTAKGRLQIIDLQHPGPEPKVSFELVKPHFSKIYPLSKAKGM